MNTSTKSIWRLIGLVALAVVAYYVSPPQNSDDQAQQGGSKPAPYTLALSWHKGFCQSRTNIKECKPNYSNVYSQNNFVLHGLWPGPRGVEYCGVGGQPNTLERELISLDKRASSWRNLPRLNLSNEIRSELSAKMPGTESYLHRHEWIKHGTCFMPRNADAYFKASLLLQDGFNDLVLKQLIKSHRNRFLSIVAIRAQFEKNFGRNTGKRVVLKCKKQDNRTIITEIRIALFGNLQNFGAQDPKGYIKEFMTAARENSGNSCKGGILI